MKHELPESPRPLADTTATEAKPRRFLPRIGSPAYHVMLTCVAIFILGPLGGISAAFMNFSIGFFINGQVLAGILGSTVTIPYGPQGRHGANYMQTMAASVADMAAMGPIVQSMVWMSLPAPPAWQLILFFMSTGMFGVGVGMLYTPMLVDRLRLTYPSGLAVANILRALTDRDLLRRSVAKLGGSTLFGFAGGFAVTKIAVLDAVGLSFSTLGGGLIVGARIAIPALVVALIGLWQTPYLKAIHWLGPDDHYRKIGFVISLGGIMGAAMLDITIILFQTMRRLLAQKGQAAPSAEDWKRVNFWRLVAWIVFWGAATIWLGSSLLHQPVFYLTVAVALCFIFVFTNGIAQGISDFNPISSAVVMTVFILAALGLHDPGAGLLCASIVAIATSEGGDMQQDRSTGWRLGTNRVVQFRYQVIGIVAGAVLTVALAKLFMHAYPILMQDQFAHPNLPGAQRWQSAFTFKIVGALRGITRNQPEVMSALRLGIVLGLLIELARKIVKGQSGYKAFAKSGAFGKTIDFLLDAIFLPSPYAYAFGGFVEFRTVVWWAIGGVLSSLFETLHAQKPDTKKANGLDLPEDMSTASLVGGGLIAGDALSALAIGLYSLLQSVL